MKRQATGLLLECTHPDHQGPRMLPRGWFARSGGGRRYSHCRDCRRAAKSQAAAVRRLRIRGELPDGKRFTAEHSLLGLDGFTIGRSGKGPDRVTAADVRAMLQKQGRRCACGCTRLLFEFHIDHVIPLAKGGRHVLSNLQLLAPVCNLKKGSK